MERERDHIYSLMMSALDGEALSETDSAELETCLLQDAQLNREWLAMQRIDALLRHAPLVQPPLDFAHRTLSRLPENARQRRWVIAMFYGILLLGGLLPVLAGVWLFAVYGDALQQLALVQAFNQTIGVGLQAVTAVVGALGAVAANAVREQPFVMAWVCVLLGIVLMWRNVYRYMMQPVAQQSAGSAR